jgi:hypothetical protein
VVVGLIVVVVVGRVVVVVDGVVVVVDAIVVVEVVVSPGRMGTAAPAVWGLTVTVPSSANAEMTTADAASTAR